MDLSNYAIDKDFRLVYKPIRLTNTPKLDNNVYIVWGVSEEMVMHGVGSFLKKHKIQKDFSLINIPTFQKVERYYENLNNLFN